MKRFAWLSIMLAVMTAVALTGCGAKNVYGADDKTIKAKQDGEFTIKLEENPTTGYSWNVTISDESIVTLADDEYVQDEKSGELVGSGGTRVLTFRALKAGETTIDMVYERSWAPDPTDKRLQYTVTVS